ncbi:MAG TPA: CHRD domain-containing protein [Thermoanaerobaculia bacterium]|nr:CHRD domain-containing protein [Thermoanaerobaculia bacterium]
MRKFVLVPLAIFLFIAMQVPPGHEHGGPVLFLAQAAGAKTVPPSGSAGTATGAFLVDPQRHTMSFDLTYHGLEHGGPRLIALHNFGPGRNGERVHAICGAGASACPEGAAGNVSGTWEGIDNKLLFEIANSRLYVQIDGGDGKPELRAQLEPNSAMTPVRNFAAHLTPMAGAESRGVGTAVLSEVHFGDGRVQVFYQLTVANTKGEPRSAELRAAEPAVLPGARLLKSHAPESGGTLTGSFELPRGGNQSLLASSRETESTIVVTTAGFPKGELAGLLKPVN